MLFKCSLFLFTLWAHSAALFILLELDYGEEIKPDYTAKLEAFTETKARVLTLINELYTYSITPKKAQPPNYMSEIGGAQHYEEAKEHIDAVHRARTHVEDLYAVSSKVDEKQHPDSVFIHTPPGYAQQHKYFAQIDKNGIITLYDGFFAIQSSEERAKWFLYSFFRSLGQAGECSEAMPNCAMAYVKMSQRISKKTVGEPVQTEQEVRGAQVPMKGENKPPALKTQSTVPRRGQRGGAIRGSVKRREPIGRLTRRRRRW